MSEVVTSSSQAKEAVWEHMREQGIKLHTVCLLQDAVEVVAWLSPSANEAKSASIREYERVFSVVVYNSQPLSRHRECVEYIVVKQNGIITQNNDPFNWA